MPPDAGDEEGMPLDDTEATDDDVGDGGKLLGVSTAQQPPVPQPAQRA